MLNPTAAIATAGLILLVAVLVWAESRADAGREEEVLRPQAPPAIPPRLRLTEAAQDDRDDFVRSFGDSGNCSCHLWPPCPSCTHPGHPLNQAEDPEAWEVDHEEA